MATPQQVPLSIAIAPFPEGFQGDMDETFQQACQLMAATIAGNFLTGLILPPGSTLPTTDQGPIAIGNVWYFWDPVSSQYLPQTVSSKIARNYVKNPVYQIQQIGPTFTLSSIGVTKTYDMAVGRATVANVLGITPVTGPAAGADNDYCPAAIKYTVGSTLAPTPAATDVLAHEHLIEGTDLLMIQGEVLSLSFSVFTNTPGTYSYYLTNTGRDASYVGNYTITTPNVWTRIKVPGIPALPTGIGTWNLSSEGQTGLYIGFPMCIGSQWRTANLNSWLSGLWYASNAAGNMCTVSGNYLTITGVKLEASPAVSYLSVPSFDQDFWECIRYYYTTFVYQSVTAGMPMSFVAYAAAAVAGSLMFPRRMCKVPTVVPYSSSTNTAGTVRNISTSADVTVATLPATAKGAGAFFALTGAAVGNVALANITADARLS